jgi:F-type H+-transporting ATPase subunit b
MFTRLVSVLVIGLSLAWLGTAALGEDASHAGGSAAAGPAAGKPSGGDVNPLAGSEFKADLAVWTAVVFLVLLAILWKFAWGPLAQGLDRREQAVAGQIAQAEQANRQAKDLLARYQQQLADAKEEVRGILDQSRRDAEHLGREMLDRAKQEAQTEHQRALREIDNATAGALKELADRSATLAVELAGKILGARLDPEDHRRLIEQAVTGFAKQEPSKN